MASTRIMFYLIVYKKSRNIRLLVVRENHENMFKVSLLETTYCAYRALQVHRFSMDNMRTRNHLKLCRSDFHDLLKLHSGEASGSCVQAAGSCVQASESNVGIECGNRVAKSRISIQIWGKCPFNSCVEL